TLMAVLIALPTETRVRRSSGTCRVFPFRLGEQPVLLAGHPGEPAHIRLGVVPAHMDQPERYRSWAPPLPTESSLLVARRHAVVPSRADNSTKDGRPHRGTARAGRCNPAGLPRRPERRLGLVEAIAAGSEGPQHEVVLPRPFAVSKFDVTFADWAAARNLWDAC